MALAKGMALKDLIAGFHDGIKGVVLGSVILLLAITIGGISKETGGSIFLVEQLGEAIPYFLLPVLLQILTMVIAFSTGTSWGTYAVAFPLAMPLAWAVAGANGLAHPELFMTLCFAAVMDGSVYGDQCSPISDTTVLSSMCTGLRPDGPRQNANPAGDACGGFGGFVLDRGGVLYRLVFARSRFLSPPVPCVLGGIILGGATYKRF